MVEKEKDIVMRARVEVRDWGDTQLFRRDLIASLADEIERWPLTLPKSHPPHKLPRHYLRRRYGGVTGSE